MSTEEMKKELKNMVDRLKNRMIEEKENKE